MINRFNLRDYNPLSGLDEPRLVSLLNEGERGSYASLQWLYRFIEKRNPTARAVKRRLLAALGKLQWDIKVPEFKDQPEKAALAEKQKATLRAAYDQAKGLRRALTHLALAEMRGFAHVEKIYAGTGTPDPWAITELRPVEQWFWCRDGHYAPWTYNPTAMQGRYLGVPVPLSKFIIREIDDPANEIIAKLHVRQETSDGDWDGFLEDYGVPPMFVEMPPNVPPTKEAEYQDVAEKALSRARGAFPSGAKLQTPSATGSGGAGIFLERLKYLDGQIVIAGTSGKLTILSESGSGTLAGGAQADAFDDIAQAIAELINETMWESFDAEVLKRAFPDEPALAYFEFCAVDDKDSTKALTDAKLAKEAGYTIGAEELSEKSGYQLSPAIDAGTGLPPTETSGQEAAAAAANQTKPADPSVAAPPGDAGAVQSRAAEVLKVAPDFLAPARSVFDELLAKLSDGTLSDAELLASADDLLKKIPTLAEQIDMSGAADALTQAMRKAAEETLQGA